MYPNESKHPTSVKSKHQSKPLAKYLNRKTVEYSVTELTSNFKMEEEEEEFLKIESEAVELAKGSDKLCMFCHRGETTDLLEVTHPCIDTSNFNAELVHI